jgi:glycosyltransferase involved in cell wall biosynthesis
MPSKKPVLIYIITKSELGGAQRHVYDLISSLHKTYEIHLVVGATGWLVDMSTALGVYCHHLPILNRNINLLKDLLAISEFARLVNKIKPDLIHAHSGKPGVIARLAGAICRVPVIFTAHGWGFSPNSPTVIRNIAFVVEKLLAPLAAKIICVCESDRQLAIKSKAVAKHRLVTIHNGIEMLDLPQANPAINPLQLIMVARFTKKQKDHHTLLQAIKIIKEQIKEDIKVVLVGTGPDWEQTKQTAKDLNILDNVDFVGDRLDVPNLLAQSQVFVLSTHYEGFPISVLEAMRAGLPVIATKVNGISEQVVDGLTGLLVPHLDVYSLVSAIVTLIDQPELRQTMGAEGAKKLAQQFTLDCMSSRIDNLYQSAMKDRSKRNIPGTEIEVRTDDSRVFN